MSHLFRGYLSNMAMRYFFLTMLLAKLYIVHRIKFNENMSSCGWQRKGDDASVFE